MSDSIDTTPVLTLFGVPSLAVGGKRLAFTTDRPFQLLAYLATSRRWVRRDELADILYPERDSVQARSNLRKVLLLAGRIAGVDIERQGDLLRWSPASDLREFEAAIDERRLPDAIALAKATLLEGFDDAFLGDGRSWLLGERLRITTLWQSACAQWLATLAGKPTETARLARTMLERDPLDEPAVQALARAHIALGEGEAARVAIASYSKRLADELGLEPTASLRDLADIALRTSISTAASASAPTVAIEAFVGRRAELNSSLHLLRAPDCRLFTLVGPGGVGKTAFAKRLGAGLVPDIVDEVVFVPLADLTDADQLPARIADYLGTTMNGTAARWPEIAAAFGERSLALVLDNAEQLDVAAPLEGLLTATTRLKLVVTSRARLGLASETAFVLEGLPLPDNDESDVDVLRCCDSVALFESRALAAARSFDLAAHAAGVVRLVLAVEGLPLAIELAAVWTRVLPVAEIADEIARSVDLLEGDPGSNRGLRASFAQSWRLLSNSERACLPRLALLPGDFARDLASQVARAPLPVLAALVDKSLLRADGEGRFSVHPLLRRCAAEHVDPDDQLMARLAAFLAQSLGDAAGPSATRKKTMASEITREIAHVRAAWWWALEHQDAAFVASMARLLSNFYEDQGMWDEGLAALGSAVEALHGTDAPVERARAAAYRGLAALQYRTGALDEAEASARELIGLARRLDDRRLLMTALNTSGICLAQRGRPDEARNLYEQGLKLAEAEGISYPIAMFVSNMAIVDASVGRYEESLLLQDRAVGLDRQGGEVSSMVVGLINIAEVHQALGQPARAVEYLEEAQVACVQHELKSMQCAVALNLGLSFDALEQSAASSKWVATALRQSRQHGELEIEIGALLASAHLDCKAGECAEARSKAWQASTLAERLKSVSLQAQCVGALGEILMTEGRADDGLALIGWTMAQASISRLNRDLLARRLASVLGRAGDPMPGSRTLRADATLASALAIAASPGD